MSVELPKIVTKKVKFFKIPSDKNLAEILEIRYESFHVGFFVLGGIMISSSALSPRVYRMRAFVKDGQGGNLAGVVCVKPNFPEARMQSIAREIGYSKTAFVMPSDKADFRLRFFTPTTEEPSCGHATIAAFEFLRLQGAIGPGNYTAETMNGVSEVEVKGGGNVFMRQFNPKFYSHVGWDKLFPCFRGLERWEAEQKLRPQLVSTGLIDVLMRVNSLETLLQMLPDPARIVELCTWLAENDPLIMAKRAIDPNVHVTGIHAFSIDTFTGATAHCRNFAPGDGIDEEPATGTSNGALSAYLFHHGAIGSVQARSLRFEQGYCMKSPSEILARLETKHNSIDRVWVGGQAIVLK
ncbi:PhzF family phenazine biosynthesis protein [Candidatus Saganbacteria bacterium]|nr:PhzF family phenazine biosynthesis protein [Candidatus Saganbacteria bacterium]